MFRARHSVSALVGEQMEDDPVVKELEVYVCNEFLGSSTQLCLMQHPLRPPWRPYEYDRAQRMRMKPQCKRIEVDVPVDVGTKNYNDTVEDYKKIKQLTLRSSAVDTQTSYAIGTIKEGKLLLAPVDYCLQFRPFLNYLNVERKKELEESSSDEEEEPQLKAVEVQVQKRETERQQQARLSSYAYLNQKEDEEPWVNLTVHVAESRPAESVWERITTLKDDSDPPTVMDKSSYLKVVVPTRSGTQTQSVSDTVSVVPSTSAAQNVSDETLKALPAAMAALFQKHSICNMANIRQWLQDYANGGSAKEAAFLTDRALHDAVLQGGDVVCIRRMYMTCKTGSPTIDAFRSLVVDLLKDKEQFKRAEVMELANKAKVAVTETLYNKVVKDLCTSRGNYWIMKTGADM